VSLHALRVSVVKKNAKNPLHYPPPAYQANEGWFVEKAFVKLHYTTFEVNDTKLEFKAIDALFGNVFDSLTLIK